MVRSGRSVKRKGNGYERELITQAKAAGLYAERAYASNGRALGENEQTDLIIGQSDEQYITVQAKRRASIATYIKPPKGVYATAIREDRGESYIVIRYVDFLGLLKRCYNL